MMKTYGWLSAALAATLGLAGLACSSGGSSNGGDGGPGVDASGSGADTGMMTGQDSGKPPSDSGTPPGDTTVPPMDSAGSGADTGSTPTSTVSIIVEPGDDGTALYNSMNAAKTSLHMTMYFFDATKFIDLL